MWIIRLFVYWREILLWNYCKFVECQMTQVVPIGYPNWKKKSGHQLGIILFEKFIPCFFFFFWYYDSRCTINSYIKVIKYIRIHDADFQVEFLIKNCSFPLFLFLSYIFWWWRYYIMRKIWTSSFFFLFLVCFFYSSNNVTFHSKAEERDLNLFWISQ